MKRTLFGAVILFLVLIFSAVSCAGTPEAEDPVTPPPVETPPAQTPPQTPAVSRGAADALNAAKDLASANRAFALEVESPDYFPNEWNAAESRYAEANGTRIAENDNAYGAAANTYNGIAADFEAVALDSLSPYSEDLRYEIIYERNAAIEAGILDITPERFAAADDYALDVLAAWEAEAAWELEDYKTAIANAKNTLARYKVLKTGANAYRVRADIEAQRFASYNRTAINAVDQSAYLAVEQYDNGDMNSLAGAEKALKDYTTIYSVLETAEAAYNVRTDIGSHRFASYDSTAIDAADETAFRAVSQYNEGDADAALVTAENVLSDYNAIYGALSTAGEAYDARMRIQSFIDTASDNGSYLARMGIQYVNYSSYEAALNAADEDAYRAIDQYDRGDAASAEVSAKEALQGYNRLLNDVWTNVSTIAANTAGEARRSAVNAKAPVAAKQEYDSAAVIYSRGGEFRSVGDYESASEYYYESISLFNNAAEISEIKRQQALAAIAEAERKIAESEHTAEEAEIRIEGGAQ